VETQQKIKQICWGHTEDKLLEMAGSLGACESKVAVRACGRQGLQPLTQGLIQGVPYSVCPSKFSGQLQRTVG